MMCRLLSDRIRGHLRLAGVDLEGGDDLLEVAQNLAVHLDHTCLATGLGGGDELHDLVVLFAVLGQELGGGDEHGTGQAGVGMRAGLLNRQTAEEVPDRPLSKPQTCVAEKMGQGRRISLDSDAPVCSVLHNRRRGLLKNDSLS